MPDLARGEIHLELSVHFPDDPKVRALARFGRDARNARDLYVMMALYCKDNRSDGFVPTEQIGILAYPDGQGVGERNATALVSVGLIEPCEGGYQVLAYLKRNKSRAQIDADLTRRAAASALANHTRWHAGQDRSDPNCPHCAISHRTPDGSDTGPNPDPSADPMSDRSSETGGIPIDIDIDRDRDREVLPATPGRGDARPPNLSAVQRIVGAWVDAVTESTSERPTSALISRFGRQVKALLGEGRDPDHLAAAAASCGAKAYDDLGKELLVQARTNRRPSPAVEEVAGWNV